MFPSSSPAADIRYLNRSIADGELELRLLQHLPATEHRETRRLRIKSNLAFRKLQLAMARHELVRRKFNPNQPRVPAGNSDGGQWTDGSGSADGASTGAGTIRNVSAANEGRRGGSFRRVVRDETGEQPWRVVENVYRPDGSLSQQTVLNRDHSSIRSDFSAPNDGTEWDERHTVKMPDGSLTTFQNTGLSQLVIDGGGNGVSSAVWAANGPEPQARVQQAYYIPPLRNPVAGALAAATALYTWLSSRNSADETAVFAFKADAYVPGANERYPAIWVGALTKDQVDEACPRYTQVQSITDQAVDAIDRSLYPSSAQYGTAVHTRIEKSINGPGRPQTPDFRAEVSLIKSRDAGPRSLESKRIDVLENTNKGVVCVYDIKTGKSGLLPGRAAELAGAVQHYWPGTQRIIVIEVRPGR